jgi:hypothetical protein
MKTLMILQYWVIKSKIMIFVTQHNNSISDDNDEEVEL